MNIFQNMLLNEKIKLEPQLLTKNYREVLKHILNKKIGNKCTKYGYIKSDSLKIYKVNPGEIEQSSLNGYCIYNVYFYADLCNPYSGQYIEAKINNINTFGILALSGYVGGDDKFTTVLEIIITKDKNNKNITSSVDIDNLNINDSIIIEVIGKKFQLGDLKIQIVGKVVDDKLTEKGSKKITEKNNIFNNEDIENFNDEENLSDISENEDENNEHDNESSSHSQDFDDDDDVIIDDDDDKISSESIIDTDD